MSMTTTSGSSSEYSRQASSPDSASADHRDLADRLQQEAKSGSHHGVIIDQQHPNHAAALKGISAASRVPRVPCAADLEPAAELCDAVGESTKSEMSGPRPVGRQTDAVVGDAHADPLLRAVDHNADPGGLGVAQGVDQSLLDHAIDGERHARAEIGGKLVHEIDGDRDMAALPVAHQVLERGGEPERVERQRREARNEAVHGIVETRRLVRDQPRGVADGVPLAGAAAGACAAMASARLRIAVTDWPNSSCSSCAMSRRSSSTR